jgi:hypothetical protein
MATSRSLADLTTIYDESCGCGVGAAWVFIRSGTAWTQQGSKLVGTGALGNPNQGYAVALSSDSNTAILGGFGDNANTGAAWVFTRTAGVWTQQGSKLVGTGAVGNSEQGYSVSLSADGNTAIVGGPGDQNISSAEEIGAAWVFRVSGEDLECTSLFVVQLRHRRLGLIQRSPSFRPDPLRHFTEILVLIEQYDNDLGVEFRTDLIGHDCLLSNSRETNSGQNT